MSCHTVGGGGVKAFACKKGLGGIHGDDAAVKEQTAAIRILGTEFHIVTDHDDTYTPVGQFLQNFCKGDFEIIVHTFGRLVQQKNLRVLEQDLCQSGSLLFAAGQIVGMSVQESFQTAKRNHFSNPACHLMEFLSGEHRQEFLPHILFYQKHLGILGQCRDLFCIAGHLTPVGLPDTAEDGQCCTLTCTVAAENTQQFARIGLHGHAFQDVRGIFFIPEPDLIQRDHGVTHWLFGRPFLDLGQCMFFCPVGQLISSVADRHGTGRIPV